MDLTDRATAFLKVASTIDAVGMSDVAAPCIHDDVELLLLAKRSYKIYFLIHHLKYFLSESESLKCYCFYNNLNPCQMYP